MEGPYLVPQLDLAGQALHLIVRVADQDFGHHRRRVEAMIDHTRDPRQRHRQSLPVSDLPQVVEQAKEVLEGAGVADRCELVGGDFFQEVPSGGEAYVLKVVIHDWDDERARRILSYRSSTMRVG